MIPLHRLTHPNEPPLYINPDLIQTVEATPDTVVTLTNHSKLVVIENELHRAAEILQMNPGYELIAPSKRSAQAKLDDSKECLEYAACAGAEDHRAAERDPARPRRRRGFQCCCYPCF